MLSAITIMHEIGIEYMVEHDMKEAFEKEAFAMKLRCIHGMVSNLLPACYRIQFYQIDCGKEFDKMDTAFVIIDMQNDYFTQGNCELFQAEQALKAVKKLLEHFRAKSPLFFMCSIYHQRTQLFSPKHDRSSTPQGDKTFEFRKYDSKAYAQQFL